MAEQLTTIQIYRKDKEALEARYGRPMYSAVRRVLSSGCDHPESKRVYTTAIVNGEQPGEALNSFESKKQLAGFRCKACGRYVFPDPEGE